MPRTQPVNEIENTPESRGKALKRACQLTTAKSRNEEPGQTGNDGDGTDPAM